MIRDAERTNPVQVGLGVQIAATPTNFTQGAAQPTGCAGDQDPSHPLLPMPRRPAARVVA